ncbi:hypothetical protein EVAR_47253_1 [Eumeta japonica]|uniref:Uncharacterized protein n=1 Tax=Eumeta variegata TaxID=151549 RepID=A0A4C1XG18_EUMVA|nr:hypothetical protein EVAR_47253_1 [Eumeta japonica]
MQNSYEDEGFTSTPARGYLLTYPRATRWKPYVRRFWLVPSRVMKFSVNAKTECAPLSGDTCRQWGRSTLGSSEKTEKCLKEGIVLPQPRRGAEGRGARGGPTAPPPYLL